MWPTCAVLQSASHRSQYRCARLNRRLQPGNEVQIELTKATLSYDVGGVRRFLDDVKRAGRRGCASIWWLGRGRRTSVLLCAGLGGRAVAVAPRAVAVAVGWRRGVGGDRCGARERHRRLPRSDAQTWLTAGPGRTRSRRCLVRAGRRRVAHPSTSGSTEGARSDHLCRQRRRGAAVRRRGGQRLPRQKFPGHLD
jgi:hypothetical protein